MCQDAKSTLPRVEYGAVMCSAGGTHAWLQQLSQHGLSLVTNAPLAEHVVDDLANRISAIQVFMLCDAGDRCLMLRQVCMPLDRSVAIGSFCSKTLRNDG